MAYNLLINGVYQGDNPLTSHLLTSMDHPGVAEPAVVVCLRSGGIALFVTEAVTARLPRGLRTTGAEVESDLGDGCLGVSNQPQPKTKLKKTTT